MRRLLFLLLGPLAAALAAIVLTAGPAAATNAHFVSANVTSVTSNSITVNFKEAGLGNSLSSVNISLAGFNECVNLGGNHPKASNKTANGVSGTFTVSNGNATGPLTMTSNISPPCSPPMVTCWTGLSITDTTFNDTADIPGTFCPSV